MYPSLQNAKAVWLYRINVVELTENHFTTSTTKSKAILSKGNRFSLI